MRQLGLAHAARDEVASLSPTARAFGEAYAEGVNDYLACHSLPLELRLVGYRPEPWELADSLLTINVMSYVGLAQTQQDIEKLIIQAIHQGAGVERLKKLFAPHLDGLTGEIADLVRRVQLVETVVPVLPIALPAVTASNNWAVAPSRSATGTPLECHDPHLETNRLPAVWYEAVLQADHDYHAGITMPGVPGVIMGRTRAISAGFTYGFMDMVDYFIEECRDGKFRRNDGWKPFQARRETIWRSSQKAVEIIVFENEHGTLECDPRVPAPADGYYLCRAYSAQRGGAARSLGAMAEIAGAKTVTDARRILREVSISGNWVIADRAGNIGYQQSGLLPRRAASGLYPLPGWQSEDAWQGLVPTDELAWIENPPEQFIATANDDRNQPGRPQAINVCQGSYRVERIAELLRAKPKLTVADMKEMQADLFSTQARRFMVSLRPLVPDTPTGRILAEWDLCYDRASRGATLFEGFYQAILRKVFGEGLVGLAIWDAVVSSTNLLGAYFQVFDEALLGQDESWFAERGRDDVFRAVLEDVLSVPLDNVLPWGETRRVMLRNIFLGGKLPAVVSRILGVDYGPISVPGGRATICQGQIFRTHGRLTTFAPSYRSVTDLGRDEVFTALAGGPSGRIFSGLCTTDLARWMNFEYKTVDCHGEQ
jgi:penicillin amidase